MSATSGATLASRTIPPVSSTMQIAVSSNDTSKPAYFVMAALRWLDPLLGARLKPDPATSIRGAAASETPPQSSHLSRPRSVERGRLEARRDAAQLQTGSTAGREREERNVGRP